MALIRPLTQIEKLEDQAMVTMLTAEQLVTYKTKPVMINWAGPRRKVNKKVRAAMKLGSTQADALTAIIVAHAISGN